MGKYIIQLEVEESSELMAYQLLAIAIKKKYKNEIRPYFSLKKNRDNDDQWLLISGQSKVVLG